MVVVMDQSWEAYWILQILFSLQVIYLKIMDSFEGKTIRFKMTTKNKNVK